MFIEPVTPFLAAPEISLTSFSANSASSPEGFSDMFLREVASVNDRLSGVDLDMQKLATGSTESVHAVMIRMEEAHLSFQLLAQVRNKLLEAYQEVMKQQV